MARLLLTKGADVHARTWYGSNPLLLASDSGHLEVVQLLLANGADVDAKTKDGSTALHYASERGHLQIVRLLIAKGADVYARASGNLSKKDEIFPYHGI